MTDYQDVNIFYSTLYASPSVSVCCQLGTLLSKRRERFISSTPRLPIYLPSPSPNLLSFYLASRKSRAPPPIKPTRINLTKTLITSHPEPRTRILSSTFAAPEPSTTLPPSFHPPIHKRITHVTPTQGHINTHASHNVLHPLRARRRRFVVCCLRCGGGCADGAC